MVVHLVTLGWDHPSRIIPSIIQRGLPAEVILLRTGDYPNSQNVEVGASIAKWIGEKLDELGIKNRVEEVNPFEVDLIVEKLVDISSTINDSIYLNITGGTKIMAVAAMVFASVSDKVDSVYYATAKSYGKIQGSFDNVDDIRNWSEDRFVSTGFASNISVPRVSNVQFVNDSGCRALISLLVKGSVKNLGDLAEKASNISNLSPNTIRSRINSLMERKIIAIERSGRSSHPCLTKEGEMVARIIQKSPSGAAP